MTKKSKVGRFALAGIIAVMIVLLFASCAPPESERMPPAVSAIPNVGAPRADINIVGANFEPGEKVTVCYLLSRGSEEAFYPAENIVDRSPGGLEVDKLGSFQLKVKLPQELGVWPVRVYDQKGEMIASTVVMVEEVKEE